MVGLKRQYNGLTSTEQLLVDRCRSFTTAHADIRLWERLGIVDRSLRRWLQAVHAEAIICGDTWCMGLGTRGDEMIHEVLMNDGSVYYPVWAEPLGPVVTYLTKYMAYRTTRWEFLL